MFPKTTKKIEAKVTVCYRRLGVTLGNGSILFSHQVWLMKLNSFYFLGHSAKQPASHLASGIGNKKAQKYWFLLVPLILNDRSLRVPLSERSYSQLHWFILSFEIVVLSPVSIYFLCWYRESICGPLYFCTVFFFLVVVVFIFSQLHPPLRFHRVLDTM